MTLVSWQRPLLCGVLSLAVQAATAAPVWITLGEDALAPLRTAAPQARTLASARAPISVPAAPGSRRLVAATEAVYAVELDDSALPALSGEIHKSLRRCSGFIQHTSKAEALAALQTLQAPPQPQVVPTYRIANQNRVHALLPQLQASNVLSTIQQLSDFQNRRFNSSHGADASMWLYNAWQQLNPGNRRDVKVRLIQHAGWVQKSVEFEILGSGNSGETVILGAHLDSIAPTTNSETVRAPGADDDASGIAALTEIIRVLMANNYAPQRNIRFLAYSAEEVGLLGSQDIVAQQALRRDKVVGVMQLDMTAYQGNATDLWLFSDYTDTAQNQFVADLATTYLPELTVGFDVCGYGCSDHAAWSRQGFIASFPFEASMNSHNPYLHSADDTVASFGGQASHALKFTKLAAAYLLELASDPTPASPKTAPSAVGAARR